MKKKQITSLAFALALGSNMLSMSVFAEEPNKNTEETVIVEEVEEETIAETAETPPDDPKNETEDADYAIDEALDETADETLEIQLSNTEIEGFNELVDQYNQQEIENLENTETKVEDNQEIIEQNDNVSNEAGNVTVTEDNSSQTDITIDTGDEQYELSTSEDSITITEPSSGKTCTITTTTDENGKISMLLGDEVIPLDITLDETFSGTSEDSVEQYNQAVKIYNQAIDDYIAKAENVNEAVAEYKEFFTEYNKAMEAYNSVINSEVTQPKQDAIRDENAEVLASPNQDSRFEMNDKKLESFTEEDKTEHKKLKDDIDKAKGDLESDEAKEYDLITETGINAYNALVSTYNDAIDKYNSFVEKVNSLLDPNAKPSEDVKPLEAQSNPLYIETDSEREVKYYIRKDNGLPKEDNNNEYANDLYTDHEHAPSSGIIVGTELKEQINSENVDSKYTVEVQNLQKASGEMETYTIDGKIYHVADNGLLVDESGAKYQFTGSKGDTYYYQAAADGKVYVAKSDGNNGYTYEGIAINEGGLRTNTSEENQEIIINEYLAHKLNFESEDAMKQYYTNINTLLGINENDPDYEEKLEAAIRDQICGGDVENPIYQAMYPAEGKPAGIDVLWYVIKDSNTGTIGDGIHADGLLYWRDTLEMVDANRLNTMTHLKWVKAPVKPVEENQINMLNLNMVKLNEKEEIPPKEEAPMPTPTPVPPVQEEVKPPEPEPIPSPSKEPIPESEPEEPEESIEPTKTPEPEIILVVDEPSPSTVTIDEEDTPLAPPVETVETVKVAEVIEEKETVPMSAVPKTGDFSIIWYLASLLSGSGLFFLKKRKN